MIDLTSELEASPQGAILSECGAYRWLLWRELHPDIWDEPPPENHTVAFVMLNPSVADASVDDPTIRRCIAFGERWAYRRLVVANLFALRATDPRTLYKHREPIGPDNDAVLHWLASNAQLIICAWGAHGVHRRRDVEATNIMTLAGAELCHLGTTQNGSPKHPLYLRADTEPQIWRMA